MRRLACWIAIGCAGGCAVLGAHAGEVILRVRAINPLPEPQPCEIRLKLPAKISTNDVLDANGLILAWDGTNSTCLLHRNIELESKGVRTFRIRLRDVWAVPDNELPFRPNILDLFLALPEDDSGYKAARAWWDDYRRKTGDADRNQAPGTAQERYSTDFTADATPPAVTGGADGCWCVAQPR